MCANDGTQSEPKLSAFGIWASTGTADTLAAIISWRCATPASKPCNCSPVNSTDVWGISVDTFGGCVSKRVFRLSVWQTSVCLWSEPTLGIFCGCSLTSGTSTIPSEMITPSLKSIGAAKTSLPSVILESRLWTNPTPSSGGVLLHSILLRRSSIGSLFASALNCASSSTSDGKSSLLSAYPIIDCIQSRRAGEESSRFRARLTFSSISTFKSDICFSRAWLTAVRREFSEMVFFNFSELSSRACWTWFNSLLDSSNLLFKTS